MRDADHWLGLEIRHLVALEAVAEERSFAAAAARLGYTQSAVSQQIAGLERIVGKRLLERPPGRRPTGLTPAGELVLRHGKSMLARVRAAQADLDSVVDGTAGSLRVGTYQSIGLQVLPGLLPRLAAEWPQVRIELHESASDVELLELVERGELDLTFCMLPVEEGPFVATELLADPYVLVLPTDSPLAVNQRRPTIRDIAKLPLIGFRSCRNDHRIEGQLRARGMAPNVVFRSDDNGTVQALVGAGVGAALMPRLTVDTTDPRTVAIDLATLFAPRLLGLVRHRDREPSAAADAFTSMAREIFADIQAASTPASAGAIAPRRPPTPPSRPPARRGSRA
jgi:DNA-binding transcriptional LysR family regulator